MKIHPRDHDLILGTFGRAFYILDDIRPLREIARSGGKVLEKSLRVFPAPDAYLANYRSYAGFHFPADGIYEGENRRAGAMITLWHLNKGGKISSAPERAKVTVKSAKGDVLRRMSMPLDTGMNRIFWDLRQNGVAMPSRREAKPDDDPPPGNTVAPGNYWIIIAIGGQTDSTLLKVLGDPRESFTAADYAAQDAGFRELELIVTRAEREWRKIQDARKAISRVEAACQLLQDSTRRDLTKEGKMLLDSLGKLENLFMMPDGLKGIQRSPSNIQRSLFAARSAINAVVGEPTQAARNNLGKLVQEVAAAEEKIAAFLAGPFQVYRKRVESQSIPLFK